MTDIYTYYKFYNHSRTLSAALMRSLKQPSMDWHWDWIHRLVCWVWMDEMGFIFVFSSLNIWENPIWIHKIILIIIDGPMICSVSPAGQCAMDWQQPSVPQVARLSAWSTDRTVCVQVVPTPPRPPIFLCQCKGAAGGNSSSVHGSFVLLRLLLVSWQCFSSFFLLIRPILCCKTSATKIVLKLLSRILWTIAIPVICVTCVFESSYWSCLVWIMISRSPFVLPLIEYVLHVSQLFQIAIWCFPEYLASRGALWWTTGECTTQRPFMWATLTIRWPPDCFLHSSDDWLNRRSPRSWSWPSSARLVQWRGAKLSASQVQRWLMMHNDWISTNCRQRSLLLRRVCSSSSRQRSHHCHEQTSLHGQGNEGGNA